MYVCDKISLEPKGLSIISLLWLVMSSIIVLSDPSHNNVSNELYSEVLNTYEHTDHSMIEHCQTITFEKNVQCIFNQSRDGRDFIDAGIEK